MRIQSVVYLLSAGDNSHVSVLTEPGQRGVSLMEVAVTVAILSLLISGALSLFSQPFASAREDESIAKLVALKRAIIGDPRIVTREARTDFGFLGDIGNLPTDLDELWILGAAPVFSFDTTLKLGGGWAGPYVQVPPLEMFDDIRRDAWGTEIAYSLVNEISPSTGQTVRAKLISYGPDTAEGGGDDLTVEVYETDMISTVTGFVRDAVGNPLPGVVTTINFPLLSVTSSAMVQTDANGAYSFPGSTYGNRSLIIQANLVYVQGTGVSTGGQDNDVEFVVQNYSASDVTFDSITFLHDSGAFYETLRVDNFNVFSDTSDRVGTGETISFADEVLTGTGNIATRTFPIRIQAGFTLTPTQDIGKASKKGGAIRIQALNFKDAETGAASNVDMTGISFQVTFSDGSAAIFTTVRQ